MGFFFTSAAKVDKNLKGLSHEFLRRHSCNVCPLNNNKSKNPKLEPTGSEYPEILIVGSAPTEFEDREGEHFAGKYTRFVKSFIPKEYGSQVRYTSAINCHKSGKPDIVELNCCYPRLVKDVEKTKPKVIFGFGHAPLFQIVNPDSKHRLISLWAGRKLPVKIGNHVCWYYSFDHPLDIIQDKNYGKRKEGGYNSQDEFVLACDLKRAFVELKSLPNPVVHSVEQATENIEITDDLNTIADYLNEAAMQPVAGVDIETNCLRPYEKNAKILTIGISTRKRTFAFPVDHSQSEWSDLERKQLDVLIRDFLYKSDCTKTVHNLPFELEWFGFFYGSGFFYKSNWEDSQSQAYLLDARRGALSLDFLCLQYFGLRLKEISSLDRENLDKAPLQQVLKYNAIDARYHRLLYRVQANRLKNENLLDLYEHQIRRIPALVLTQVQGVPVDQSVVKTLRKKYEKRANEAASEIVKDAAVISFEKKKGRRFNPSSVPDVNFIMKEIIGADLEKSSKGELEHIDHPLAKLIVKWREANKVISTYIAPLDEKEEETAVFPDAMLHPIISTTTVVSGRSSSASPNIQNFPKRDEERKEVRSQVRHKNPDMKIVSFDYAGIQARNVAMESRDKKLIEAYWNNYDIHSDWLERINKHYPKWIPKSKLNDKAALKQYRYLAKNKLVFPTFFGAQAFTISEGLGIPKNICEDLREEFFDEFPEIKKWHQSLDDFYYKNGYVTGCSGYICRAPIVANQRINLPIQGDEACIVTDAWARLSELEDPRYQPILMVHDDLTFLIPKKEIEKRSEVIIKTLINVPFEWANVVPIEVEGSYGDDWINMKEFGKFANNSWNGIVEIKD